METKIVYSYDKITREYAGEYVANESPRRPGTFIIPANATEIAPPKTCKNKVAVFDKEDGQWSVKADHRGEAYYDTTTQEKIIIVEIGVLPDSMWTTIEPTDVEQVWTGEKWEVPFNLLVERKKNEIAAARYATATGIIEINGSSYNIDNDSRTSFLGTLSAFEHSALTSTVWKTEDGFITLNEGEFSRVIATVFAYVSSCFVAESDFVEKIEAASTAEEISAVEWVPPDVHVINIPQ